MERSQSSGRGNRWGVRFHSVVIGLVDDVLEAMNLAAATESRIEAGGWNATGDGLSKGPFGLSYGPSVSPTGGPRYGAYLTYHGLEVKKTLTINEAMDYCTEIAPKLFADEDGS